MRLLDYVYSLNFTQEQQAIIISHFDIQHTWEVPNIWKRNQGWTTYEVITAMKPLLEGKGRTVPENERRYQQHFLEELGTLSIKLGYRLDNMDGILRVMDINPVMFEL